jgi:ABC-2 type transport system ATP-binding protein
MAGFNLRRVDDNSLEIEVQKGQHINEVFDRLNEAGIRISSMRNRANRLEEMFVNLVEGAA